MGSNVNLGSPPNYLISCKSNPGIPQSFRLSQGMRLVNLRPQEHRTSKCGLSSQWRCWRNGCIMICRSNGRALRHVRSMGRVGVHGCTSNWHDDVLKMPPDPPPPLTTLIKPSTWENKSHTSSLRVSGRYQQWMHYIDVLILLAAGCLMIVSSIVANFLLIPMSLDVFQVVQLTHMASWHSKLLKWMCCVELDGQVAIWVLELSWEASKPIWTSRTMAKAVDMMGNEVRWMAQQAVHAMAWNLNESECKWVGTRFLAGTEVHQHEWKHDCLRGVLDWLFHI